MMRLDSMCCSLHWLSCAVIGAALFSGAAFAQEESFRLRPGLENLLVRAEATGNLASFGKGLRGAADHVIFDPVRESFVEESQWHEYGVGYGESLGVVPEEEAAEWMAEWPAPVEANYISLTGVYPNQPQPDTAWKIEARQNGAWKTLARGVGGWYNGGRYAWGAPDVAPISLDALRVRVFSKDDKTPIRSIHFRGDFGHSWVVAHLEPEDVIVPAPFEARVTPLDAPVLVGQAVSFDAGESTLEEGTFTWDFGDGQSAEGKQVTHTFQKPDIYQVQLTASDGKHQHTGLAIVRVHTPETLRVPQVHLDTDQKNEQDDQHYFGYALFSQLDVLGVNSIHHGGGQEPINYREILHVLDLALDSGLSDDRVPFIFRGADRRLEIPESGKWYDTVPETSDASRAILASVRGASPDNPVWVVPVGPGTNVASAILQARAQGLELRGRMRIMWLGGSNDAMIKEFNGNNDPWSMYVIAKSGVETWIVPAPVGARVSIDKRTEAHLYADHPLGDYLESIVPAKHKALFDASALSSIISLRLGLGWIKETEFIETAGPDEGYRWIHAEEPTTVRVIREIDQKAMQLDLFNTMKGKYTPLVGAP